MRFYLRDQAAAAAAAAVASRLEIFKYFNSLALGWDGWIIKILTHSLLYTDDDRGLAQNEMMSIMGFFLNFFLREKKSGEVEEIVGNL